MPLPVTTYLPLAIPEAGYNASNLATRILTGGRYGGDWVVPVILVGPDTLVGKLEISRHDDSLLSDPRYPELAVESAYIWLNDQAKTQGLRVLAFRSLNSHYGPGEREFFCTTQAIVAHSRFVPVPGAAYADEMTLDAVMRGASWRQ